RSAGQPGAAVPTLALTGEGARRSIGNDELTHSVGSDRLFAVGCALSAWLRGNSHDGAPAKGGGRAGSLSDLVRAGIENDFERVVFSQLPELRDIKRALERAGSRYASLSGSGSTLYGLFESVAESGPEGPCDADVDAAGILDEVAGLVVGRWLPVLGYDFSRPAIDYWAVD